MNCKFFVFAVIFFFVACHPENQEVIQLSDNGVFVINEGNFTYGNASLSFIDFNGDSISNNVFYGANKIPLGDVAQSGEIIDDKLFIVVNNSGKIWVVNRRSIEILKEIPGFTSPRYILQVGDSKAYVSDLYSPYITILDLDKLEKAGTVFVGASTEQMVEYQGFVYVCNWSYGRKIYKISVTEDKVVDSLQVAYQPNSLRIDKYGRLWVLSDGGNLPDTAQNEFPALTRINLQNFEIDTVFYFASKSVSPVRLCIDPAGENLFFLVSSWNNNVENGGVFRMRITDTALPQNPLIPQNGRLFYSLAIAEDGKIFVSDAKDYLQNGDVLLFDSSGSLINVFQAGIIPGGFVAVGLKK